MILVKSLWQRELFPESFMLEPQAGLTTESFYLRDCVLNAQLRILGVKMVFPITILTTTQLFVQAHDRSTPTSTKGITCHLLYYQGQQP